MPSIPVAAAWRVAKIAAPWVVGTFISTEAGQKQIGKMTEAFGQAATTAGVNVITGLGDAAKGVTSGFGQVARSLGGLAGASIDRLAHTIRPKTTASAEAQIKPPAP